MKKFLFIALAFVPLLSMAQDDMYFTPKKKSAKTSVGTATVKNSPSYSNASGSVNSSVVRTAAEKVEPVVYNENSRTDDDYNRRYTYNNGMTGDDWQTGGGADSLAARVDSVDQVSRFDAEDDENDYYYSRRLLRFHTPGHVYIRNPYYWDLVYGCGIYDYLDTWYTDPFYWHYGWGYGWSWGPWSCWYGPMWGWNHPYAYDYWGWGWGYGCGYYYGGVWGGGAGHISHSRPRTEGIRYYDRNSFGNRTSALGGRGTRTNTLAGGTTRTSRSFTDNRGSRTGVRGGSDYASRTGARYGSYGESRVANGRTTSRGDYSSRSAYSASRSNAGDMGSRTSASRASSTTYRTQSAANAARTSSRSSNSSYSSYTPSRSTSSSSYSSSSSSYSSSSSSSGGSYSSGGGASRSSGGGFSGGGGGGGSRGGGGRR